MDNNLLIMKMTEYYTKDPARIQHFMKVYGYSRMIGEMEGLDGETQEILETAAILHDIGIKKSEELYGDAAGKHQEELGPAIAEEMLREMAYPEKVIERVSYLVGHHHTYENMDGQDYQILVEADFLVNLYEDHTSQEGVRSAMKRIFKTSSGTELCQRMFLGLA